VKLIVGTCQILVGSLCFGIYLKSQWGLVGFRHKCQNKCWWLGEESWRRVALLEFGSCFLLLFGGVLGQKESVCFWRNVNVFQGFKLYILRILKNWSQVPCNIESHSLWILYTILCYRAWGWDDMCISHLVMGPPFVVVLMYIVVLIFKKKNKKLMLVGRGC